MASDAHLRSDIQAGVTVALVAVPQCMGFAAIAGLPPVTGLYAAVVMALVNGLITRSKKSILGPAITISSMVYGVLASVAADEPSSWPAIAALLAVLVGGLTLILAMLRVGELVRYVSRSVLIGLTVGVGVLIFGAQLAPFLGVPVEREPRLAVLLYYTLRHVPEISLPDVAMGLGTMLLVIFGGRLGRRFPAAFVAIVAGGVALWLLERAGVMVSFARIDPLPSEWLNIERPGYGGPFKTDLVFGAAAITVVAIIQTLAMSKAFAAKSGGRIDARRELIALGVSNLAAGFGGGFPGAESMSRSAINDLAGAQSRWSGIISAIVTALIAVAAAPLSHYVTKSAIAGLMMATAWSVVDWREVRELLSHGRHDRVVLVTTVACLLVLPIHWAVLIGLSVSIAVFLRRASRLHLFEMVAGGGKAFHEQPIDEETGRSPITMLQVEGPLFFAHAEEMADVLRQVFKRAPVVTIIRMRRTQQIDFSVITELNRVVERYLEDGGTLIICGLTERMHEQLSRSPLGRTIRPEHLLKTTRTVFGSAHLAIKLGEEIAKSRGHAATTLFRRDRTGGSMQEREEDEVWAYQI